MGPGFSHNGTVDSPWDRWFSCVHDGSDEATKEGAGTATKNVQ